MASNIPPQPGLTVPAAAPAAQPQLGAQEDYRIGPQDLIEIQVYGVDSLRREVRVNSRGAVSLPLIGAVTLSGLTGQEAEALIAAKYEKDYLQDPQVSVFIKEFTSQRLTIEGAVMHPGIYPMKGETSLLQAIAMAGGQGQLADLTNVMLYRNDKGVRKSMSFDLVKIRAGELPDPALANDDLVVVLRQSSRVTVRDSLFGDILGILNPFNYLSRP